MGATSSRFDPDRVHAAWFLLETASHDPANCDTVELYARVCATAGEQDASGNATFLLEVISYALARQDIDALIHEDLARQRDARRTVGLACALHEVARSSRRPDFVSGDRMVPWPSGDDRRRPRLEPRGGITATDPTSVSAIPRWVRALVGAPARLERRIHERLLAFRAG